VTAIKESETTEHTDFHWWFTPKKCKAADGIGGRHSRGVPLSGLPSSAVQGNVPNSTSQTDFARK
jgi:hypothetical protein